MLNDSELYNVHAESAEIETWSILSIQIDYVGYNRKLLSSNRVKLKPTEENATVVIGKQKVKAEHVKRLIFIQ